MMVQCIVCGVDSLTAICEIEVVAQGEFRNISFGLLKLKVRDIFGAFYHTTRPEDRVLFTFCFTSFLVRSVCQATQCLITNFLCVVVVDRQHPKLTVRFKSSYHLN
jgi:hypothetical protein